MNEVFEVIGNMSEITTIAVGSKIRGISDLRERFGRGRWRKLKEIAQVKLQNGRIRLAELHWYVGTADFLSGFERRIRNANRLRLECKIQKRQNRLRYKI